MSKTAVFPGSFDPITIGHQNIVNKAIPLFDKIIVAVGNNSTKQYAFNNEQRKQMVEKAFANTSNIEVVYYNELTVDLCKKYNANFIIRGLRNPADFQYEQAIAQMNHAMHDTIETLFFACDPEHSAISSTIVREIWKNGGDITQFLPKNVTLEA